MVNNAAQLINQDSGKTEYYTPLFILEAAREVLGTIDLDPASSALANVRVRASKFYTEEDNGLCRPWFGKVWLNHPFSRQGNPLWIKKLITQYELGNVSAACCITYASTSEQWFRPLFQYPMCFIKGRVNYFLPDGSLTTNVTKGSVVTYLGMSPDYFAEVFSEIGDVVGPAKLWRAG